MVRTVDWNTPGLRDIRDRVADDGYTTGDHGHGLRPRP